MGFDGDTRGNGRRRVNGTGSGGDLVDASWQVDVFN